MAFPLILASDIHGSTSALQLLIRLCDTHKAEKILIAGDLCPYDGQQINVLLHSGPHFILVRGNCDNTYAFSEAGLNLPPVIQRIEWDGRTIVMTHGDRHPSPFGLELEKGDIFVHGHTHIPHLSYTQEGFLSINPGSTTHPRSSLGPTYALLEETQVSIRSLDKDQVLQVLERRESDLYASTRRASGTT